MTEMDEFEYAGFWVRVLAEVIDSFLRVVIIGPILLAIYGDEFGTNPMEDFFFSGVVTGFAVILFWVYRQATPGKMAISARIVDAKTGEKASTGQYVGRYFAYVLSGLVFGLGFFWIAFDKRKQGWHDKLAGTVVIKKKYTGPDAVRFESRE